jgi:DNA-binding SARP family transcriptional activator
MAILFAATYPERAESLTLWGSGPSMVAASMSDEERKASMVRQERFIELWGTSGSPVVDRFAPSLAGDQSFRTWHQRYERNAASTESLRDLLHLTLDMDVREVLPTLNLPTLVLHRVDDRVVDVSLGRELAKGIPGARMIEYPGQDHFSFAGETDDWMSDMERFVTGEVRSTPAIDGPSPSVRIKTLGRFAVERDSVEVPTSAWGSRRARQLCKRLVAARGWPVTRDELIDLLWPDESDRVKLGARLSVQLSAVRRVLGGGVIADRETVRLDVGAVFTDLEAFHKASDDGAIVATYTGAFLPEDIYDDWTAGVRDEARARFIAAARRAAQLAVEREAFGDAAEYARRLVTTDPYDEGAHRLLISALQASGEAGEARRAHASWTAVMAELGIQVTPLDRI